MPTEWLLYVVIGVQFMQFVALWLVFTFRRRIAHLLWKDGFENLMWLSFAQAAEEQQSELENGGELGMAGGLAGLIGNEGEGGILAHLPELIQAAQQLDGDDLGDMSGSDAARVASDVSGWKE